MRNRVGYPICQSLIGHSSLPKLRVHSPACEARIAAQQLPTSLHMLPVTEQKKDTRRDCNATIGPLPRIAEQSAFLKMLLSSRGFRRKRNIHFRLSRIAKFALISIALMYLLWTALIPFLATILTVLAAPNPNHQGTHPTDPSIPTRLTSRTDAGNEKPISSTNDPSLQCSPRTLSPPTHIFHSTNWC